MNDGFLLLGQLQSQDTIWSETQVSLGRGSVQLFHWAALTVQNPLGNSAAKELWSF